MAIAAPMPFEAPVTSAILFCSAFIMLFSAVMIASKDYARWCRKAGSAILQASCTILQK
jgi:hypothetical protein